MASIVPARDRLTMTPIARVLSSPWLDRLVALAACVPFAWTLRHEMRAFGFNFAWIVTNANFILLVATMLIRRAPSRVTPQPLYWLLAFVATYWLFIAGRFATTGLPLAPAWVIFALSLASCAISVWARLSLGRSIGLVPAHRGLVTKGAYRYMRHPIYTGIYLSYLALALQNYSPANAAIFAVGAGLFMIKSFVEEDFLRQDAEYASYMIRVPWRWLPFVV
ncbi:MAG TPA: methyltransferase [Rhizomicrobium sp.]|nr:methyltransferase [Rhizomicrobium sp.]